MQKLLVALCVMVFQAQASRVTAGLRAKARGNSMIAKVVEMLGNEKEKIKADLTAEGATMSEYMEWCDDTQTELSYAIKDAKAKIEDLTATITDNSAQIAALDEEITDLGNEIAGQTAQMEEAIAIREKEKAEFLKAEAEQVASVQELEEMEVALKKQMAAFAQTPAPVAELQVADSAESSQGSFDALLQTKMTHQTSSASASGVSVGGMDLAKLQRVMTKLVNVMWVDPESKQNLATLSNNGAFVQEEPAATVEMGADAVAGQQKSNEDNLAAFEGLKGKAEESLQKQRDEETKKQAEHDMNVASLKQAVALAENNVDNAKKDRSELTEEKAKCENELSEVEASKASSSKSLEATTHECQEAADAWTTRQDEAKAEQAAIEKAKGILSERVTVLIQVSVTSRAVSADAVHPWANQQKMRQQLVNHFRALGNRLHSLAMLNIVSVATQDPMQQVKDLLTELIAKLEKQAAAAAGLHEFCQEEKNKTKAALKKKDMTIDKLSTRVEKAEAAKQEQEDLIAENSEIIAATQKGNAEATKLRNEEHNDFLKADADFSQAAEAVDDAMDALKEYYGDASFVQTDSETDTVSTADSESTSSDDGPPALGGAKKDSAGGILSILETIGDEFRKTVKDNAETEREAQKAYDKLMNDNKVLLATKNAEIKGAETQLKMLSTSLEEFEADLKMSTKEKDAILEYVDKLKPQCEGRVVPYAERKAKREAEIDGLKEGLAILEGAPEGGMAFLQIRQHNAEEY